MFAASTIRFGQRVAVVALLIKERFAGEYFTLDFLQGGHYGPPLKLTTYGDKFHGNVSSKKRVSGT